MKGSSTASCGNGSNSTWAKERCAGVEPAGLRHREVRSQASCSLPTPSPAKAAQELERAVTKLGFKGAMINGHVRGEFLDNGKYWIIFECAQALNVPIYLHPTIPHPAVLKAYFEGFGELATPAWGFAMDTCTHFLRLVFAGLFDAYPDLRMILGHLGEGLSFWIHRPNDHTQFAAGRRG